MLDASMFEHPNGHMKPTCRSPFQKQGMTLHEIVQSDEEGIWGWKSLQENLKRHERKVVTDVIRWVLIWSSYPARHCDNIITQDQKSDMQSLMRGGGAKCWLRDLMGVMSHAAMAMFVNLREGELTEHFYHNNGSNVAVTFMKWGYAVRGHFAVVVRLYVNGKFRSGCQNFRNNVHTNFAIENLEHNLGERTVSRL